MATLRALLMTIWPLMRRTAVLMIGTTVLLLGVALLVLPGPAFVVIPMGLGILAIEFAWAHRWLRIAREKTVEAVEKIRTRTQSRPEQADAGNLRPRPVVERQSDP